MTDLFDADLRVAQFEGDSLLERIAREYERVIDELGVAYDREALAENEYLRLFQTAWAYAVEDKVAATTRSKHCDNQPDVCAARQEFVRASAGVKRLKAKADELQHRLVASMSHARFTREATGG